MVKGKISSDEKNMTMSRITKVDSFDALKDCQFLIEAVKEDIEVKHGLFKRLSDMLYSDSQSTVFAPILATNTSSISITKIASQSKRPDRVIGMHFMNPVPVMKLVEVIRGLETSPETMDITLALAAQMNKTTTVSRDIPGFIANRCLMPYINESVFALYEVNISKFS